MWLEFDTLACVVKYTPLISIDLIVENYEKEILLGRRKNKPAKGYLFVPGGRILKNESIAEAFKRITTTELGCKLDISGAKFLGVFEHFYNDSFFSNSISTHYIVLAYKIKIEDIGILDLPYDQHEEYLWLSLDNLIKRQDVHDYTKAYFQAMSECKRI